MSGKWITFKRSQNFSYLNESLCRKWTLPPNENFSSLSDCQKGTFVLSLFANSFVVPVHFSFLHHCLSRKQYNHKWESVQSTPCDYFSCIGSLASVRSRSCVELLPIGYIRNRLQPPRPACVHWAATLGDKAATEQR